VTRLIEGLYKLMLSQEYGPVNPGNPQEINLLARARLMDRCLEHAWPAGSA